MATSDTPAVILQECEQILQYQFRDQELLERCLTHASIARTRLTSNERLEFLGDAILGAIVCEMLYHRFPEQPEGDLTRIKSMLVSRATCAKLSEKLGLDRFLFLGKGITVHESIPESILAAVFESLVGGVYIDGGMDAAKAFVTRAVADEVERSAELSRVHNYKSILQQVAQKQFGDTPGYRLLDEKGPDHSKCFKIAAVVGTQVFVAAWGANKKEAEQRAARNALCQIEGEPIPYAAD